MFFYGFFFLQILSCMMKYLIGLCMNLHFCNSDSCWLFCTLSRTTLFFFIYAPLLGTKSTLCDPQNGQKCTCFHGIGGRKCDRCLPGFWSMPRSKHMAVHGCKRKICLKKDHLISHTQWKKLSVVWTSNIYQKCSIKSVQSKVFD